MIQVSSFANTFQNASFYSDQWRASDSGFEVAMGASKADAPKTDPHSDDADQRRVEQMKATDRAVRAHEAAHMAAGGHLVTSGASFTYETGPDGQRYAVAGEVGIDTSRGRTPQETLARAEQVRAAALAPADPSGQDRSVAAAAAQMAADARAEIARSNVEKTGSSGSEPDMDRARSFSHAIERSLSPNGRSVDFYA